MKPFAKLCCVLACCVLLCGCGAPAADAAQPATGLTAAMDTLADQTVYGPGGPDAIRQVNEALAEWDARLSLFAAGSDIAAVNTAAGSDTTVDEKTAQLLADALALSPLGQGAFALTVAPLTLAWGVTGDAPRVPPPNEIAGLLPLVDDAAVQVEGTTVRLPAGMALDLGGVAKGAFCQAVRDIYSQNDVTGGFISIGGNVYTYGTKPDGTRFRIGFRDPARDGSAYIASIEMEDEVFAVSGGYERFFEAEGQRFVHIIDPATGYPVESDILSVGVVHPDGLAADFWSTTLYVWGREATLAQMKAGRLGAGVMLLDDTGTLYVSESLRDSFEWHVDEGTYALVFVKEEGA